MTQRPSPTSTCACLIMFGLLIAPFAGGCSPRKSTFQIVDYRDATGAVAYSEDFNEAFYAFDESGNLDLILRRETSASNGGADDIKQIVHLHSFWRCVPGKTTSSRTQINTTVSYVIMVGDSGASFEGAGSMLFQHSERKKVITGTLDYASLKPKRRTGAKANLFQKANLTGEFRAVENVRRTRRAIHEIEQLLGPIAPERRHP